MRIRCLIGAWKREMKSQPCRMGSESSSVKPSETTQHLGRTQWLKSCTEEPESAFRFRGRSTTIKVRWMKGKKGQSWSSLVKDAKNWILQLFYSQEVFLPIQMLSMGEKCLKLTQTASSCFSVISFCPKIFPHSLQKRWITLTFVRLQFLLHLTTLVTWPVSG